VTTRIAIAGLFLTASAFGQNAAGGRSTQATHYPKLIHAELPLYPPIAQAAHIAGTVEIQVTVEKGAVVDAQVKSGNSPYLSNPSLANVKTWQFQPGDRTTFLVKYVYRIEGEQTSVPENPKVELELPHLVTITARPLKPSCFDCGAQNQGSGVTTASADPKDGSLPLQIPVTATAKPK
jgi:hypothetical protein